jgi:ABC transport system ATP-binding/permease protein
VGGWADYLRQRQAPAALPPSAPKALPAEDPLTGGERLPEQERPGAPGRKKLSYNEVRELERLPGHIHALESELAKLRDEAAGPEFYKAPADRIREVLARIEAAGDELDAAMMRWVTLEERGR